MTIGITLAPVLTLRIAHGYYGKAAVPLALEPTAETTAALRRGGCRLRVTQDLAQIYAQVPFGAPPVLDPAAPATLTFRLTLQDPDLPLVTAPDWGAEDARHALSLGPAELAADGTLPSSAGRSLPVVAPRSRVQLSTKVTGAQIALRPAHAAPGDPPPWTAPLPPGEHSHLDLTAEDLPEAAYTLQLDGTPLMDLILSDIPPARLYGLVTVPLTGATPVGEGGTPTTLTVQFAARAPRWRYVLQPRQPGRDLSGARITADPGTGAFSAPRPDTMAGRTVWVCDSNGPLPLALRPPGDRRIALSLPAGSGPPLPPRRLPEPGPANTAMARGDAGPEAWSTLYITV